MTDLLPVKDPEDSTPVPPAWRGSIAEIVRTFVEGDFRLSRGLAGVEAVDLVTAGQIKGYLEDYGETLACLPEEAWGTSISQWQLTYWEVLVDLWTEESGKSDLVLHLRVSEADSEFSYRVDSVYVP